MERWEDGMSLENELDYCVAQVKRTLASLPEGDYMQTPRNIGPEQKVWNFKKVCREEWTEGFWPGILWYA